MQSVLEAFPLEEGLIIVLEDNIVSKEEEFIESEYDDTSNNDIIENVENENDGMQEEEGNPGNQKCHCS